MLANTSGKLAAVNYGNNIEMLVLKETDIKTCVYDSSADQLLIQQGDLVRVGTFLTPTTF